MSAPLIETVRLRLRAHRPADLDVCAALWSDPIVTRYISGRPFSREEVWARLLRYAGHWLWMGYGFWIIEEKSTGAFAGELGFAECERDLHPRLDAPEAGWALSPRFHGRGYAEEALRAILAWEAAPARAACLIHAANLPSIRLAQKCGFTESARAEYRDQPTIIFHREVSRAEPLRRTPA